MSVTIDIAALHASRTRILALFADVHATWLDRAYAPGKWTARQLLFHIADAESVILDRVRRSLADDKPLVWSFDQDDWSAVLVTPKRDLRKAAELFTASLDSVIDLVAIVDPTRFERPVVHNEAGKMKAADWINGAARHANHHATQVEAIIAGRPWPTP